VTERRMRRKEASVDGAEMIRAYAMQPRASAGSRRITVRGSVRIARASWTMHRPAPVGRLTPRDLGARIEGVIRPWCHIPPMPVLIAA
jgi:hypothetical protein